MPQSIRQIKVFISCPSDVEKEKNIVSSICETISRNIFAQKNIDIRTIHWAKDVPRVITGEEPQKIIDRYLDEEDYDIYVGILWGRFGEPQSNGLTPTEGEFEEALKRYKETGRPLIKFFLRKKNYILKMNMRLLNYCPFRNLKRGLKPLASMIALLPI